MAEPVRTTCGARSFSLERDDGVAVLRFCAKPLFFSADLGEATAVLKALERCNDDPDLRAIVLLGFPEKAGSREYSEFLQAAARSEDQATVVRMLNLFGRFIMALVELDKIVVFADSGRVISQFINVALVCDHRIVGDDTLIEKAYLAHGLVPKGGGTRFLAQLLGRHRALALLLDDEPITASQSLALGLVDEVVPAAGLEQAALAAARRFAAMPATTVAGLKRLLSNDLADLADYLDLENRVILRALANREPDPDRAG